MPSIMLEFEKPIAELEAKIEELKTSAVNRELILQKK